MIRCEERKGAAVARHRVVVAVDLAGHGESGGGRRRWTMPAFGEDVAAVVRHLELGRVVLVGHSMGGDVVVEAALRLGDQVAGVVWVDAYDALGNPPTPEELERFQAPFREDFPAAALARHGVRAVVLAGAGHFLMLEDPDGFNRLLAEVVDGFARR